ncbi:MAG: FAD-dependent oxidoreductase [Acidimicrobiaceae bacterium]|nr:FAD-dependent oxidoreductase [Acidimicrobiaceae bacterium]
MNANSKPVGPAGPESSDSYDAVVIGAGIIGAATTLELARRGWRVLCVDKAASAGAGSTLNSCAIVRFSYSTKPGVVLAWEGLHYWLNWRDYTGVEDELGLIEYRQCGQVVLLSDDTDHPQRVRALWHELGIPFEEWTSEDLARRLPIFDQGCYGPPKLPSDEQFWEEPSAQLRGAIYSPEAGYVNDPQLSVHNLQRAAEAAGACFMFNSQIVEILRSSQRVSGVALADGARISASVVVNVAGPHSYLINQMAGVYDSMKIKTRALRHEVHHVPAPDGFDYETQGFTAADDDTGVYYRPEVGNHILIGSGDPTCDEQQWVHPDSYDNRISDSQWEAQVLRAGRRIPGLGIPHQKKGVVDLYDVSDDWVPIYDRTDLDGFYVAIGTSGNQYKNGSVAGHVMAELITAVESGLDHDNDPLVVTGRYTGMPIEVGFFSRNREAAATSMSVHG